MGTALTRILIGLAGLGLFGYLDQVSAPARGLGNEEASLYLLGMLVVLFLTGFLMEIIPFPQRWSPSWGGAALAALLSGFAVYLSTPAGILALGPNPFGLGFLQNRAVQSGLTLLMGNLVARSLIGRE